jgi:hypothetical protein
MEASEKLIKKIYAQFGAVNYFSEVLHRDLCHFYALASFDKAKDITDERFEEKRAVALSMTLGQIVEKTKEFFPSDLQQRLTVAFEKRNYFWHERIPLMYNGHSLFELHQELIELNFLFIELHEAIFLLIKPRYQSIS